MTLNELSVSLSQKIDDPIVLGELDGSIVTSAERENYLRKAYGFLFAFLSSIQDDDCIAKTFPYIFKLYLTEQGGDLGGGMNIPSTKIDVTSEIPVSVYYKDKPLSSISPTLFLEAIATKNKKNFWVVIDNKFQAFFDGIDVTIDGVKVITKTMNPDFEKVNELEQYYSDMVILLAAREAAMDFHNNDRFMALTQLVKEWTDLEVAKLKLEKQNG